MYIKAKKSLGQHFLKSAAIVRTIVEKADILPSDVVLEVGPGRGVLTEALLERAGKVIAVEKDNALAPFLRKKFAKEIKNGKLELVFSDILTWKPNSQVENYKVVANIPYYITGEFLRLFLSGDSQPQSMTLLLQKEVAERIVAHDGKESILSISVKAYGLPKYVQTVPADAFLPPPKVDSAILHISNISKAFFHLEAKLPSEAEEGFFRLVKTGFAHKRKLLASNLKKIYEGPTFVDFVGQAFEICAISQNARAENVPLDKWKCLFALLGGKDFK